MTKSYDRELLDVLTKTLTALERIQTALNPLLDKYREQVRYLPDLPIGAYDCPVCTGMGYTQFIDPETDLWTTKACECQPAKAGL